MERVRSAGCVDGGPGLALLFQGLEGLERMVGAVRDGAQTPVPEPGLVAMLALPPAERGTSAPSADAAASAPDTGGAPEKKALA